MASDMFGWDLTFKTVQGDISKKQDVVVAFIHWYLVKRGFRCLGIGDEKSRKRGENGSELLPDGWNLGDNYTLRYVHEDEVYILHGLVSDGNIIVNVLKASDLSVSNLAINIDSTVASLSGPIEVLIPKYTDVLNNIRKNLLKPAVAKCVETQTPQRPASPEIRPLLPVVPPPFADINFENLVPPMRVPFIGESDLEPLAPMGRGMIYDPFFQRGRNPIDPGYGIPGGLPRGSIPPGARFDPVGPPICPRPPPRSAPPDADHFPPPPGYDDMFM